MTRRPIPAAVLLGLLCLAACNAPPKVASNQKICATFAAKPAAAPGAPDDGSGVVDDCAKRWAYSLASSPDRAEMVGEAVVAACNTQLTTWNRATLGGPAGDGQAESLTTGQPSSPIQEHMGFIHARALLYVIQARAGACAPPPATHGVPDGLAAGASN